MRALLWRTDTRPLDGQRGPACWRGDIEIGGTMRANSLPGPSTICRRHVPVWDKSARYDGTFSRADFVFDRDRNIYVCPGGAELTSTGNIDQGHIVYYRANKNDCSVCSLKRRCTTAVVRKVTRDVDEDVRDQVRAQASFAADFDLRVRERVE